MWGEPSGTVSDQTLVTFTDDITTLKLCKAFATTPVPTTTFPFTFTTSGPAGPSAAPAGVSLLAGTVANPNCVIVGQFRAGTLVTITEGAVPGTGVESIVREPVGEP